MNDVLSLNHPFIFALASSGTFALSEQDRKQGQFQKLDVLTFPDKGRLRVFLRSLKQAVWVAKQVFDLKLGFPSFYRGLKKVKLPLQIVSSSQLVPDSSIAKQNVFASGYTRPECIQKYTVWCPGDSGTAVGKPILVEG
jgi:hypothetical protein